MTDLIKYLNFKHEQYLFEYFQGVAEVSFCNTLKIFDAVRLLQLYT